MVVINAEAPKPLGATRRRVEAEGARVDAVADGGGRVTRRRRESQLALNRPGNLALGQAEQVDRFQLAIVGPTIREISLPRRLIEYGARESGLLGLTSLLVIGVEEELVGVEAERAENLLRQFDWAADAEAELVLDQLLFFEAGGVVEKGIGVYRVVAVKFEELAVEVGRAARGHELHLRRARAIGRAGVLRDDGELGHPHHAGSGLREKAA